MNIQQKMPATAEEFLVWNEGREGKREFVSGKVVEQMMINVTRNHGALAVRLAGQLLNQLPFDEFIVTSADFAVRTADGIRYPDAMVEKTGGDGKALASSEPLLLAEVLSASSMADDFGKKAIEYFSIPTLRHYLVLSQDEVSVWLWTRKGQDWQGPDLCRDVAEPVFLAAIAVTLDLKALYSGIAPAARN